MIVTVDFSPSATGQQDAGLDITSNDPDESPLEISLTGVGELLTHTINASAGTGGQITPAGSIDVANGDDQSFTITADTGHVITDVLVDGTSVGAQTSYTFSGIVANHTIAAQFAIAAGITVSAVSNSTGEDGTSATFTVVLNQAPSDTVQIPVASDDLSEATVSGDSLSFSPADWDTPQTVTITGVDDDIDDGDQNCTIVLGMADSTDPAYDGMDPSDLTVVNLDNDTAGISVGPVSCDTEENGHAATFTVVLTCMPTNEVEISVACSDTTEGEVSPSQLFFMPADWDTAQTITVTGVDDDQDDGDVGYTITLTADSADAGFDGISPPDTTLVNIDNDDTPQQGDGGGGGGGGGCFISNLSEQPLTVSGTPGKLLLLFSIIPMLVIAARRMNQVPRLK